MVLNIIIVILIVYCTKQLIPQLFAHSLKKVGSYTFMYMGVSRLRELLLHTPGHVVMQISNNYRGEYKHIEKVKCPAKEEIDKLKYRKTKRYDVYVLPAFKQCYVVCDEGTLPEMNIYRVLLYSCIIIILVLATQL